MNSKIYNIFKRIFDILFSLFLLILLSPLFIIISFLVKINSRGPIFYRWKVVGIHEKFFESYKFRTMVINADEIKLELLDQNEMNGPFFKMTNDPRITSLGKFLRKFSLDELPQIISVIKGDMSLVGPRPPLQEEFKFFSDFEKKKLAVKPGMTCLWQVEGRNNISDSNEWIKKDLEYIEKKSFLLDLTIILKTIYVVFRGTGK